MKVPVSLTKAFGEEFQTVLGRFAADHKLLDDPEELTSVRFLSRSVAPHISKLSSLFNREEKEQSASLDPYWKESSNPANFRLAYFLYFMPANLYRVASVWSELGRLGFKWKAGPVLKGIEFGAGPASGACGIIAGESDHPVGIPQQGNFALIEQDRAMLELGGKWFETYSSAKSLPYEIRPFHRKIELKRGLLPPAAPKFNLWVSSFFLNEFSEPAAEMANALVDAWEKHLEDEGVVILVEPALKLQSRRLLEIRRELIAIAEKRGLDWLKILLPCLGHQTCGALAEPEDWCHEDVSWWRPPYYKTLDTLCSLDRKSLPFSYLVIAKSKRSREEILPAMRGAQDVYRLVSPAHKEGRDKEFFICGQDGKRRARYRPKEGEEVDRGDILEGTELHGNPYARIDRVRTII